MVSQSSHHCSLTSQSILNAVMLVFRISIGNGHFSTNATYGLIARNTLYSGNAAHWFNQVHQVKFLELLVWIFLSSFSRSITPAVVGGI